MATAGRCNSRSDRERAMKPFCEAEARTGKPICSDTGDVYPFIGMDGDKVVFKYSDGSFGCLRQAAFFMAPTTRKVSAEELIELVMADMRKPIYVTDAVRNVLRRIVGEVEIEE